MNASCCISLSHHKVPVIILLIFNNANRVHQLRNTMAPPSEASKVAGGASGAGDASVEGDKEPFNVSFSPSITGSSYNFQN
jgi:hypothetical protein